MSLLNQVRKEIKTKYPAVYKDNNNNFYKLRIKIFRASFLQIFLAYLALITIVVLYTFVIDFNFFKLLNINFEDNIKTFTTGIITLVSMNLFVTNLLFTHLKDERDEIQSIIDEKVNFKFITYLGFSTIIFILSLYFISPTIKNSDIKANILILIFCSFIFYIFQLVMLYNLVFSFIHKEKRDKIVKDELHLEFSRAFYVDYLKKEFNKRYIDFIESKHKFKQYSFFKDKTEYKEHISIYKNTKLYLKDININSLEKKIEKIEINEHYYHKLELDKEYEKETEISILSFSEKTNINFSKDYSFSKKRHFVEKYNQDCLDKLLKKTKNDTLNNKFSDLKNKLNDLGEIYTKYLELEK